MPLDSIFLTAVLDEINPLCAQSRIDKVQQPEKDKIILSIRGRNGNRKLLICARPGSARLHCSSEAYENPQSPPMFCMLLRKHLAGARITELYQPPMERIVQIGISGHDELGGLSEKKLILELMGRYTNIILTDSDGIIIDALRRVDEEMSRSRRILPGLRYELPPVQGKADPMAVDFSEIRAGFENTSVDKELSKWILDTFSGFSPLICRELAEMGTGIPDARILELSDEKKTAFLVYLEKFLVKIREGSFVPFMLRDGSVPYDFSYAEIKQYAGKMTGERYDSFSELLEDFYTLRDSEDRLKQRAGALIKSLKTIRDRTARKALRQREELLAAEDREKKRRLGDIITANLHLLKKGDTVLRAQDFYSQGEELVEIKLDPLKTPQQNAAKYYRDYNKLKTAEKFLHEQIDKCETEIEYLDSVLETISRAKLASDISEIRLELNRTGFLKEKGGKKRIKELPSRPMVFNSSDGFEIIVGKNNLQNEKLTFKTAQRYDIWLHAQKIHGSHTVIRCGGAEVPEKTIEEAAIITACHSQCSEGQKVPVDYTAVRNVKRQPDGKPGMVFYTDYKTVHVMPDRALTESLCESKNKSANVNDDSFTSPPEAGM